ncbi:MAG: polyhydroxyalkanoate synthesis regulator [Deltaproteobacteria bacterium]|nr:polyhydroxyalkanoate synthesis regulator [Deltaproteobacteria bacterium]
MFNLIKKTLLTGIGLTILTKEKVEEVGKELAKKGKLSEKEGKKLVDDLLKRSEQANKELEEKIENSVRKVVEKLNLASKDDIAKLSQKIEQLEKKR